MNGIWACGEEDLVRRAGDVNQAFVVVVCGGGLDREFDIGVEVRTFAHLILREEANVSPPIKELPPELE